MRHRVGIFCRRGARLAGFGAAALCRHAGFVRLPGNEIPRQTRGQTGFLRLFLASRKPAISAKPSETASALPGREILPDTANRPESPLPQRLADEARALDRSIPKLMSA